jgi:competence protein ComEC
VDLRSAPAALPAAAFCGGAALAADLAWLPVPLLAALLAAALAAGRRGRLLAWAAAGLLWCAVRVELPERRAERVRWDRPVEALAVVVSHPRRVDSGRGGWSVEARLRRLRQGREVAADGRVIRLDLPDGSPSPALGSPLRLQGYLGRSAGFANPPPIAPGPWRLRVKAAPLVAAAGEPGPLAALSAALRRRVEEAFDAAGRRTPGTLLARALLLGDTSEIPPAWKRGLRRSGLAHLLAVSGFNLSLLAGIVWLLCGGLDRRARLALVAAAVIGYVLLVGPLPAVLRAALMSLLLVAALLGERPPAASNALALAVLFLVAHSPRLVGDVGFQLTVAATAGLVLLTEPLAARWTALSPAVARPLAATAAAQLCTLPWALPAFHQVSLLSPLLNVLCVPWTAVALVAAFAWTALALAWPPLAAPLLPLLDLLAAPFAWLAAPPAALFAVLPVAVGPLGAWALAATGLALLWWPRRLALVLALAIVAGRCGASLRPAGPVEARLLDVGQGDAILLRDGRAAALVDGGGWSEGDLGGHVLLPALAELGVRRLAAVALTHPDRDHCRGLVEIADYLPVEELWTVPGWRDSDCARELLLRPGVRLRTLWAGETRRLGRWRLRALHPGAGERASGNDQSLVLLAEVFGRRLLLTGDVEATAERRLLARNPAALLCDVLKVAHHGSQTSSSSAFLAAARPRLALISAGRRNPYGHPAPEVLDRLERAGARVLRTDRDGQIVVRLLPDGRLRLALPGAPR